MMLHSKAQRGFSLIEVIVVMAIMTTLLALSGGLLTKSVDQQERLVELEKVHQLFKRLSYQAYYRGHEITLRMHKNQIIIDSNKQQTELNFSQLTFVANDYVVTTKASVSPNKFSIFWSNNIRHFDIPPMYQEYQHD